MKRNKWKNEIVMLFACIGSFAAIAQINPEQLRQYISSNNQYCKPAIKAFYTRLNYNTVWIQKKNEANRNLFFNTLKQSAGKGLSEQDYQFALIESIRNGTVHNANINDSLEAECRITDAALHFYNNLAYGNTKPDLGYNGLNYIPGCFNIPDMLADHVSNGLLPLLATQLSPSFLEITAIENKLSWFQSVISIPGFREDMIRSNKVNVNNKALILKLFQLGILDTAKEILSDSTLKQKVKEAQRQFNLLDDGILRTTILQQMNIPLPVRLKQLILSLNYYRWLSCLIQEQPVIVVNIPGTNLKVYRNNEVILEMRMIVGKISTPTPTLASKVDEVILYPYWHVPNKIATKELLPAIKRDPGYIDAGNYQVLNKAGDIVDPYSINWHALSRNYFPYIIRQSTGCDNALGLIKLNFYNPFSVYLHDTPNKYLFKMNKRFFSHGCMRMEKPMDLGHLVLVNNPIAIDTLEQKGCLLNQYPIIVPADVHMPVIVWYNPAGVDSTGRVHFYEDIYGKFDWMKSK